MTDMVANPNQPPTPEPVLRIRGLSKAFGAKRVLDRLDLDVREGECLAILGPSGCGKSVLLKHIIGLLAPDEGEIFYRGRSICDMGDEELNAVRREFGMLFQGAALFDSLTVGENVSFALREHTNLSPAEIAARVDEKLALVGLPGIARLKPSELSGGMKKRVGLARAIAMDPRVILYDEPTTGLDPVMVTIIDMLTKRMNERLGVTTILVTHDLVSAFRVADRLAMHFGGRIIATGTPEEFRSSGNEIVQQFIRGSAEGPITEMHHNLRFGVSA